MERRALLGSLGSVLFAGCTTRSGGRGTDPGTATPPTSSPSATDSGHRIAVERVHAYTHAVRLNDLGETPPGTWVPTVEALNERRRAVVQAAIDGTYRTDSVPTWLARFVQEVSHVRTDGQFYRLDASVPTTTITAEGVERSEVSGEVATYEEYRLAVYDDGVTDTDLLARARRDGLRLEWVRPGLELLLDRYDAVEYRGDVVAVSALQSDPGPPYTVTATPVSPVDAVDAPVWQVSNESSDVQAVVRDAASRRGLYRSNGLPDGVVAALRDHKYAYIEGTFYWVGVEHAGPHLLSLRVTVEDARLDGDGARLRLVLENDTGRAVTVSSGPPRPFGVLYYHPPGPVRNRNELRERAEEQGLLWSPAYRDSRYVHTDGRDVESWSSVAIETTLAPAGTLSRTFTVLGSPDPGTYVVEDTVRYDAGPAGGGTFPYEVRFRVEESDE